MILAVTVVLVLPWGVHASRHRPEPPAEQLWSYSQATAMLRTDAGDPSSPLVSPAAFLARVRGQTVWSLSALGSRLTTTEHSTPHLVLGAIGLACVAMSAWRGRGAGEIFALVVVALLAVWHVPANRLLLPVVLFVGPAVLDALRRVLARALGPITSARFVTVGVLLLAAIDSRQQTDWTGLERRQQRWRRLSARIAERIATDAVVAADSGSWDYAIYLERPVYTLKVAWVRRGLAGVVRVLERYGVDTVIYRGARKGELHAYLKEQFRSEANMGRVVIFQRDPRPPGPPRPPPLALPPKS